MANSGDVIIMYVGYITPLIAIRSSLFAIGGGLIHSLNTESSAGKYLGYQLILSSGQRLAIQVPVIVCQAFSEPADIPAVAATLLCEFPSPRLDPLEPAKTLMTKGLDSLSTVEFRN